MLRFVNGLLQQIYMASEFWHYIQFFSSGLTQPQNQTPKEDEVTAIDKSINKNVENMLSHIVNLLDSEQNFEYLWPDLELLERN